MGRELSSSLAESTASSGLILVLKLVQSSPGFEAELPGVRGFRSRPGVFVRSVAFSFFLSVGNLFCEAIRAEDSVGWGV